MNLFKALYIVAIGILIAAFVGFGIETFYPSPKAPEYPTDLKFEEDGTPTEQARLKQQEFDQKQKDFQDLSSKYNQNVAIIAILISVILLAAAIVYLSKFEIIGDSVTLGGVFTLFYGIIRAIATEEAVFRFIAVGVALVVVVSLTYWRFLRNSK